MHPIDISQRYPCTMRPVPRLLLPMLPKADDSINFKLRWVGYANAHAPSQAEGFAVGVTAMRIRTFDRNGGNVDMLRRP